MPCNNTSPTAGTHHLTLVTASSLLLAKKRARPRDVRSSQAWYSCGPRCTSCTGDGAERESLRKGGGGGGGGGKIDPVAPHQQFIDRIALLQCTRGAADRAAVSSGSPPTNPRPAPGPAAAARRPQQCLHPDRGPCRLPAPLGGCSLAGSADRQKLCRCYTALRTLYRTTVIQGLFADGQQDERGLRMARSNLAGRRDGLRRRRQSRQEKMTSIGLEAESLAFAFVTGLCSSFLAP